MVLIKKSDLFSAKDLVLNEVNIKIGKSAFLIEGGFNKGKTIVVHSYKPTQFSADSPVIILLPGAGRNAADYRDAWVKKSEEYNVLVLSLEYSDKHYPGFSNYNMAGMISDVKLNEARTSVESFKITDNPATWLYNDFDRVFNLVKKELYLTTTTYDLFGHSAGGQILHRNEIFNSKNKANRILASNSGWYTVHSLSDDFPYGLKGTSTDTSSLNFSKNLVIFLGEKDDANETRGSLRRTPQADKQGTHRLERGTYFYNESKRIAFEMNIDFNWNLEIIPDVGHDYQAMSEAAADYLYRLKE